MPAGMTFLALALKTSLLMAGSGLVCALAARGSAAFRHILWSFGLALSLLLPVAVLALPSYLEIPVPWHVAPLGPDAAAALDVAGASRWPAILVAWSTGTAVLLLHYALAHIGLWRWARRSHPLRSSRWRATLASIAAERGAELTVRVLESSRVQSPCTWGVLRPILLLPATGDAWPEAQRRHALLHELAHLERRDSLTDLIARLACALHWYNPFVWFAAAQVRKLQEQACDDAVLRAGGTPSQYAQFLLEVAQRVHGAGPATFALNMARRSPLQRRVRAILDPCRARRPPGPLTMLGVGASVAGFAVLLATTSAVMTADAQLADVRVQPSSARVDPPAENVAALPGPPVERGVARPESAPRAVPAMHSGAAISPAPASAPVPARRVVPDVPTVPTVPTAPTVPTVPAVPTTPTVPTVPAVPAVPAIPVEPVATPADSSSAPTNGSAI